MRQAFAVERLESRTLFSGGVDLTFGTNGVVSGFQVILPGGVAQAMVAEPDGKLVVGASYAEKAANAPAPTAQEAVVRLLPDGSADPTFGDHGVVRLDTSLSLFGGIAIQADGKIVVTANLLTDTTSTPFVFRLNADGSTDTAFAGNGLITLPSTAIDSTTTARVALQDDGKIVVAASANKNFNFARYLPSGEPDPTFADGGTGSFHSRYFGGVDALLIARGGKIIVGTDAGVLRLTSSGAVDLTFGQKGFAQLQFIRSLGQMIGMALQPDGKIVVGGVGDVLVTPRSVEQMSIETMAATRLTTSGEIDKSFANRGVFSYAFPDRGAYATRATANGVPVGIAVDPKGRIVIGGSAQTDFAAVRLTPSGRLDPLFGGKGAVRAGSGNLWPGTEDEAHAMTVLPDGSVVVAGGSSTGDLTNPPPGSGLALMRFATNGKLDRRFGYGGRAGILPGFPHGDIVATAIEPDGKMLLASAGAVARMLPNGALDSTFGDKGMRLSATDQIDDDAKSVSRNVVLVTPLTMGQVLVVTSITSYRTNKTAYVLTRYTAAGQVDPTFVVPNSLFARIGRPAPGFAPASAAAQSDGRIVLLGSDADVNGIESGIVLARLTRRGQLDRTFGAGGVLTISPPQATDGSYSLKLMIDSQDRPILMEGVTPPDGNPSLVALRFTRDGKVDPGFSATPVPIFNGTVFDTVLRNDDTIDCLVSANNAVEVIRLIDGAPDSSFGVGGTLPLGPTSGIDMVDTVFATVAGGDYVIGVPTENSYGVNTIAAFDKNGNLDPTFGSNGKATLPQAMNGIVPLVSPADGSIILFDGYDQILEKIVM